MQRKPQRQTADPRADDDDVVHVSVPKILFPAMKHD
jgi:hypothetical protein